MATIMGQGDFRYELVEDWPRLPEGWSFAEVGGVGVDAQDNVYIFSRGDHPLVVFDREGNFLRSWGEGDFPRPHAVFMAPDGTIWLTDDGNHSVRRYTPEGKLLQTLGTVGKAAPFMSGQPFNRPTNCALSPQGDIYVADGYGNARVHKFDPEGRLILSWGETGTARGQFNIVHDILCDEDGLVYIADRENHRTQIFDGEGRYQTQWNNLHRPAALRRVVGKDGTVHIFVGELGPAIDTNRRYANLGARVSVLDGSGEVVAQIGAPHFGTDPDQFIAPHGIAVDSQGDLYVGEVSRAQWKMFGARPMPADLRCLRKLRRLN